MTISQGLNELSKVNFTPWTYGIIKMYAAIALVLVFGIYATNTLFSKAIAHGRKQRKALH